MFNIVFRFMALGRQNGGGNISKSFPDEESFEAWLASDDGRPTVVIEKGISSERCDELCRQRTAKDADMEYEKQLQQVMYARCQPDNR